MVISMSLSKITLNAKDFMFLSTDIGCWTHRMSLEAFLLQFFGLTLRRIDLNSSLTPVFGRIYLWSWRFWTFVCSVYYYYWLNFFTGYWSVFSISSWFSHGGLYISNNLSTSSRLSTLLACSCWQQFLMIFCTSAMSVVTSFFHFWYY